MHREVEGQILILTPREEFLYTLNPSGRVLWELLVRGTTEQKMVSALMNRYELSKIEALYDVRAFIRTLNAKGIISRK